MFMYVDLVFWLHDGIQLLYFQLFERNPEERLGMPLCAAGPIRSQPFFRSIDWDDLENLKTDPPFKPKIVSACYQYEYYR